MQGLRGGSLRLFQVAGITVWVHWSWFVFAYFQMFLRDGNGEHAYDRDSWKLAEYVTLFGIVLLHEFGHALACRSVGGEADQIILWPLGGVAFVNPPPRPGPTLWSIAAGPLVNVLLLPVLWGLYFFAKSQNWQEVNPDLMVFLKVMAIGNSFLLGFNLLPVYPLDGGQILHALLWFMMDRAKSLMAVSILGMIGGACGLCVVALLAAMMILTGQPQVLMLAVLGFVGLFVIHRSWLGFQQARLLSELLAAPRDHKLACPKCGAPPIMGDFWVCQRCGEHFDLFQQHGICPECGGAFKATRCIDCQRMSPVADWRPNANGQLPSPNDDGEPRVEVDHTQQAP
jgi:Zn-dependent protease